MLALAGSSIIYLLIVSLYAAGPDPAASPIIALLFLCAITLLYLATVAAALRAKGNTAVVITIFFAVLLRFAAWNIQPVYTTDYYRYIWDGKVSSSGMNPYRYPPGAKELKHLRDKNNMKMFHKINFNKVPSGYGPAAEAMFHLVYRFAEDNVNKWRFIFFLIEAVVLCMVYLMLIRFGLPPANAVIYAYNPLVLLDLCANMHLDSLMILFIVGCFMAACSGRKLLATALLAGATMVKFFPVLLFPAMISLTRKNKLINIRQSVIFLVLFAVLVSFPVLYYSRGGVDFFAGVRHFASGLTLTKWSPFYFLSSITGPGTAKIVAVSILCVLSLTGFLYCHDEKKKILFIICMLTVVILVSPVQRPWYFVWALPFCCLRPVYSVIFMSCIYLLTYGYMFSYDFISPCKAVIYFLFYGAVTLEIIYELKLKKIVKEWQAKRKIQTQT